MKKLLLLLALTLILGKNVMANDILDAKQQAIVLSAAYTAQGDMVRLKQALAEGLDQGVSVNELKEILVQAYAY